MLPVLDKESIKYITLNITPEEAQYVQDIKTSIIDSNVKPGKEDDVIFITKIIAFTLKINLLLANYPITNNYKSYLDSFKWQVESYRDNIYQNIQSIVGIIEGAAISKLELPVSNNVLDVLNELKICVNNWFELHKDDIEYEGCRFLTSQFLADTHKALYILRLAKVSDKSYGENMEAPNPNAPVSFSFNKF